MRKIFGIFEVFLGIFEKTKEKKNRELLIASGRLRVQLEERLGKPMCLSSKPFLKPISGEGKWGRTKYRRIPESEGD